MLQLNSPSTKPESLAFPWHGVAHLSRYWAGGGSLFEWLRDPSWEIEYDWDPVQVQARVALQVLLRARADVVPLLPTHSADWMELLEQEVHRRAEVLHYPTPYTDWQATLSTFGTLQPVGYVTRAPHHTFDTPASRVLASFAGDVLVASALTRRVLGQDPIADSPAVSSARLLLASLGVTQQSSMLTEDVVACRHRGHPWPAVAELARQLTATLQEPAYSQLAVLSPILPRDDALFELACVGIVAQSVQASSHPLAWSSRTPMAASAPGLPCLRATGADLTVEVYYQTAPPPHRGAESPYRTLGRHLTVGALRPDIWCHIAIPGRALVELLIECKWSADRLYVASGISEAFAYSVEFAVPAPVQRVHIVVGPDEVVRRPASWDRRFAVVPAQSLPELVLASVEGRLDTLLEAWQ